MILKTEMYAHQKRAFDKLSKIKVSALYMQQGTGKTRTALELIKYRIDTGRINHVIWLCPCSVKENLRRDIIKHVGNLPDFITICGIETLSSSINANSHLLGIVKKYKCYLIVDESNLVKNHKAIRTKRIMNLAKECPYRSILNGTPITKNYADLFAQWKILDWRILGYKSFYSFAANHLEYDERGQRIVNCLNTDYLTSKIAPYSYQVTKKECLDLPSKTYESVYFDMTDAQYEHYNKSGNSMIDRLEEMDEKAIYRLFTILQDIACGCRILSFKYPLRTEQFFKNYKNNPRMQMLQIVLDELFGEKAIIFCKYTWEIDNICDMLGDSAVKFDGSVSLKNREKAIDMFSADKQFLVANKTCAGYGLNLQFCHNIIFYSNDYNFGTRAQAEDRVHRIGQTENVHIIDIIASYTIDEMIDDNIIKKNRLLNRLIDNIQEKKDKEYLMNLLNIDRKRGKNGKNISR